MTHVTCTVKLHKTVAEVDFSIPREDVVGDKSKIKRAMARVLVDAIIGNGLMRMSDAFHEDVIRYVAYIRLAEKPSQFADVVPKLDGEG